MIKIPLFPPAEMFVKLTQIKSQYPAETVVIDILGNSSMMPYDALAYNDIFKLFTTGENPLNIEVNLKSTCRQFFLIAFAPINPNNIYISDRTYLKWRPYGDFHYGNATEQEDSFKGKELMDSSMAEVLSSRYEMDDEEVSSLIEEEKIWDETDIISIMDCKPLSESASDSMLPMELKLKPEPIIAFDNAFDPCTSSNFILKLDMLRQAGVKEVIIAVNSPGGCVESLSSMLAARERFGDGVKIITVGLAASAGAIFLASGPKGKRHAMRNSIIMIHQHRGYSTSKSIEHSKSLGEKMTTEIAKNANIPRSEIEQMLLRDYYMTAEEALEFGFIDSIVG